MAKARVHYLLVKATFSKPVTAAQAIAEAKDLAALSYEEHYANEYLSGVEATFKLKAVKRLPARK